MPHGLPNRTTRKPRPTRLSRIARRSRHHGCCGEHASCKLAGLSARRWDVRASHANQSGCRHARGRRSGVRLLSGSGRGDLVPVDTNGSGVVRAPRPLATQQEIPPESQPPGDESRRFFPSERFYRRPTGDPVPGAPPKISPVVHQPSMSNPPPQRARPIAVRPIKKAEHVALAVPRLTEKPITR